MDDVTINTTAPAFADIGTKLVGVLRVTPRWVSCSSFLPVSSLRREGPWERSRERSRRRLGHRPREGVVLWWWWCVHGEAGSLSRSVQVTWRSLFFFDGSFLFLPFFRVCVFCGPSVLSFSSLFFFNKRWAVTRSEGRAWRERERKRLTTPNLL